MARPKNPETLRAELTRGQEKLDQEVAKLEELKAKTPTGPITKAIAAMEKRIESLERQLKGSATVLNNAVKEQDKKPESKPTEPTPAQKKAWYDLSDYV